MTLYLMNWGPAHKRMTLESSIPEDMERTVSQIPGSYAIPIGEANPSTPWGRSGRSSPWP
jgi:hypothetical protein